MDLQKLAEGQGLTREEFVEIVDLLVETSHRDIEKIRAALDSGNIQAAGEAAHSIKGAAGNMGFMELSASAKIVEHKAKNQETETLMTEIDNLTSQLKAIEDTLQSERS